jgi:hypothetical protein
MKAQLPCAHHPRLRQLCSLLLTTNVSNKSENLLFAQSEPQWYEDIGFWHSFGTGDAPAVRYFQVWAFPIELKLTRKNMSSNRSMYTLFPVPSVKSRGGQKSKCRVWCRLHKTRSHSYISSCTQSCTHVIERRELRSGRIANQSWGAHSRKGLLCKRVRVLQRLHPLPSGFQCLSTFSGNLLLARSNLRSTNYIGFWYNSGTARFENGASLTLNLFGFVVSAVHLLTR